MIRHVLTPTLDIAYEESGLPDGPAVILLHGFPYDVRAYDGVAPSLAEAGHRVIVPYLRGYGPTRFRRPDTPRSGQQAALGADLLDLMDALDLPRAILAGYDWGGRAACIVAALWPERVNGLVTITGYNIQDVAGSAQPGDPEQEYRYWYQYYFHTPRGRAGLERNRRGLCRLLWRLWSPTWSFDDATFERSACSFDNPDFVDVVVQSYRHRYGYAPGDPALDPIETRLAALPVIAAPTVVLHGADDGVSPLSMSEDLSRFTAACRREIVPGAGHNLPQETPEPVVRAVLELASTFIAPSPSGRGLG
ncbi:MAG TPA: alpha/beta hydrolase [Acetobacteraceae bacterium]|nr:alpha/beta hydrolase [Acetobacteraceae bacterium]